MDAQRTTSEATQLSDLPEPVDGAGRDRSGAVNTEETHKLIDAAKVAGTAVYNADGDRLGTIERVLINKLSGKVAFVVLGSGGFLGLGERYTPLPWHVLTYDESRGGYNIDLPGERLSAAPHYAREELDGVNWPHIDRAFGIEGE
ncbi:MAG: PRC-barrel domain-containing protein [Sphingomonadaceae bacterium]|nr:PRC-barrel domain-containing protein [Sphingomonadaceae bacterium]